MFRRVFLALSAVLFCTGFSTAETTVYQLRQKHFPDRKITYKTVDDRDLEINLFTPEEHDSGTDSRPALMMIHGGGWVQPGRQHLAPHCRYFAQRGMVVANIQYRLADKKKGTQIVHALRDTRDAFRYLRNNAGDLGIDPDRIAVGGESAGGHLAAALSLFPAKLRQESRTNGIQPSALILYNPVLDLETLNWIKNHAAIAPPPDAPGSQSWRERARRLSPIQYIRKSLPPALILHGTEDSVVPIEQIDRFAEQWKAAGNSLRYERLEDMDHAFALFTEWKKRPGVAKTLQITDRFLNKQGLLEGKPTVTVWKPDSFKKPFSEKEKKKKHVRARSIKFDDWPFLDGQWEGILYAGDGNVYFGVSTHDNTRAAQVFRYLPDEDRIEHLADLRKIVGNADLEEPTQDKIHSRMFERGKYIYCGTTDGHTNYLIPHPGGHWIRINKKTGKVENLGRSITGDGLITVGYDRTNHLLYGHTNRKGILTVFDPETREEHVIGRPWKGIDAEFPHALTLMIPPGGGGKVYGFLWPGISVWEYDPETEKIRTLDVGMSAPDVVRKGDEKMKERWRKSTGRMTVWNEKDQCFYFIRGFDGALCRFYPPINGNSAQLELVRQLRPDIPRRYGDRIPANNLVIHDRTVYYTPYTGWGGVTHLVSYHLDRETYTHHGPIVVEGGRRVNECHSMTAGPDGTLYLVAFVFSIKGRDPVRPNAMRVFPFHPRFVTIEPGKDTRN